MATKKDKTEKVTVEKEVTLKKGITVTSAEADEAAEQLVAEEAELTADKNRDNCARVEIKDISSNPSNSVYAGKVLVLLALPKERERALASESLQYIFDWETTGGVFVKGVDDSEPEDVLGNTVVYLSTANVQPGKLTVTLKAQRIRDGVVTGEFPFNCKKDFKVRPADLGDIDKKLDDINDTLKNSSNLNNTIPISLQRTSITPTSDIGLWVVIRKSAQATSFSNYARFMDMVLCGLNSNGDELLPPADDIDIQANRLYKTLRRVRSLPFNDTDAYRLLKTATEAFLLVNGGVELTTFPFSTADINDLTVRMGTNSQFTAAGLDNLWRQYIGAVNGSDDAIIPYFGLIREKFRGEPLKNQIFRKEPLLEGGFANELEFCMGVLGNKLTRPFLLELIWSYWHEEGMQVQTMNAIARRFQNVHSPNFSRDPLANLEIDPLRPLNNLLWGYVQDEPHRLSLLRRVYEYKHHYGIGLQGKAVPKLHPADNRSKFLEAFHHLLYLCSIFFKQDDDTTINSDGFPLLNALREVHLILSQGAHNQFGDLPSTARQEMLIQQWLLARPEFREFLPTRNMVAYPEPWMDRVDAMKSLQGWTDVSIDHFNRLGVFGEQILLSIRFGAWSSIVQSSSSAANWARFWRAEIQGYIHDYRAVTGVDLTSSSKVDSIPPSVHLFNRYMAQARR